MTDSSRSPSIADLRIALSALYPDASQLELAIQQLSNSTPPDSPQIDGVDIDLRAVQLSDIVVNPPGLQ